MNFLAPALLVGLLAAAIPPILHLIQRRRAVVVRFPALEFIHRSNRKTRRRFRARQLLLMLLRSLLLAALAFAMARPFFAASPEAAAALRGGGSGTTVVVIDAGYPMGYRLDGERLLDRARFRAADLVDQVRGQAAVVIAGDEVEVPIGEPTSDLPSVRKALDGLEPGARSDRLPEAVARAYEVLADAPPEGGRRVVVLTTAAGVAGALPPPPGATGTGPAIELIPVDVADGQPTPNRAVVEVSLRPAPEMGLGQWRVEARVANFADTPARRLPVHLELDGQVAVRGFVDLAPGAEGAVVFHARVEGRDATAAAVVIEPDALPADDRRAFWLLPAPRIRALAINGDPHPTPQRDELFYLERAIAPGISAGALVTLTVTDADAEEVPDLSGQDVVVLANVQSVSPPLSRALEAFVRAGGGLLISVGDRVELDAYNRGLAALLPRPLRDVRAAGDAAATEEGGDRRAASPRVFDRAHPILRAFPDPAGSSLGRARVHRYLLLDPAPDVAGEVVIGLEDGAPLLVTRAVDQGRVALWTTTLDRDWGDVPIRPDFVPLIQQTLRYLTRVAEIPGAPALVGRPAELSADDPRVTRVTVRSPDGGLHTSERPRADSPWAFEKTLQPGHYTVVPDPPLPDVAALPGFAVALDARAGDLRGPAVPAADAPADDHVRAALAGGRRTELWHAALAALFALLLGEAALLFRRRRTVRAL